MYRVLVLLTILPTLAFAGNKHGLKVDNTLSSKLPQIKKCIKRYQQIKKEVTKESGYNYNMDMIILPEFEHKNKPNTVGICWKDEKITKYDRTIGINVEYVEGVTSEQTCQIVWHELGHCDLDLTHYAGLMQATTYYAPIDELEDALRKALKDYMAVNHE